LLMANINIAFPSTRRSFKGTFSFRFLYYNYTILYYKHLLSPMRATCPVPLILISFSSQITFSEVPIVEFSLFSCYFLFDLNISHNSPFSISLRLCTSLNFTDQVLHPYKISSKSFVLYISIFILTNRKRYTKAVDNMVAGTPRIII
jgi:hypothetical protein